MEYIFFLIVILSILLAVVKLSVMPPTLLAEHNDKVHPWAIKVHKEVF